MRTEKRPAAVSAHVALPTVGFGFTVAMSLAIAAPVAAQDPDALGHQPTASAPINPTAIEEPASDLVPAPQRWG